MKCKRFRQNTVLHLYDELTEKERTELESHVQACAACAREFADSQKVFHLLSEPDAGPLPHPDWEKTWAEIQESLRTQPSKSRSWTQIPKWAYAASALVVVFTLGVFLGRNWLSAPHQPLTPDIFTRESLRFTLSQHFEDIQPILVDYANLPAQEQARQTITVEREIVRQLLIQNILLKRMLALKDPEAGQLLEDTEVVLREIANAEHKDPRTQSLIKELIDERDILFKIKAYKI